MRKENKIRKSLKFSFLDGVFAACMMGLTTDYLTPYALFLKASSRAIGALSAFPSLASSLVQLETADLTERFKSRKKTITLFVLLHALMGLPIILIPYVCKSHPVFFLVFFVTLFTSCNAFSLPAWSSLMSDHIPYKKRGQYFGWRNKILGMITVASAFLAGFILHICKYDPRKGFLIIFSSAFICRCFSWYFLTRMYEPRFAVKFESYFSFFDFIKRVRESNFAKFVLFVSGISFCVNIAAPFFSVFMLRDLKFNYLIYTLLVTTVPLAQIATFDRWGRHADKIGNVKVLRLTSFFIASLPLWWVINRNPLYLVAAQIISGFAWAGFNLCATNFIYDAVTPEKRTRCIAYFNACNGLATCLGALLGGYLVNLLPALLGFKILSLFVLSSALRFFVVSFLSGKIKEVRPAEKIRSRDLFYSVIGIRPMLGLNASPSAILREED